MPYNFRITAKNSVGTGPPYVAEEPIAPGRRISKSCSSQINHVENYNINCLSLINDIICNLNFE